ncbi:MAG: hypothetical protein WA797_06620 [Acidimicrobiales bacterium]
MEAPATVMEFARVARLLADEARRLGLCAPGFRSPPRLTGVDRSLRRRAGAPPMVSVRLRGRSLDWVIEDMIQGVLVVNGLDGAEQARMGASLDAAVRRDSGVHRAA